MAPDRIVEPVDVVANGLVGFLAGVEDGPPDELGFQGLKERLHHGVVVAGWPAPSCEIAALTNTKHTAQAMDGEFRFRPVDEREPHRLPSRAKKAVAFFRMSRSCRRISFSRRSRFSSAVISPVPADGSPARRSRLRPIQRTSVESPIPRSPAIARCVRPLVCTRRTASSSNSFVNRRCCVIEFLIAHRELSTLPKQVQLAFDLDQVEPAQ